MGCTRHDDSDLITSFGERGHGSPFFVLNHLGRVLAKCRTPIVFICPAYADDLMVYMYDQWSTAQSGMRSVRKPRESAKVTSCIGSTAVRSTGMTRVIRSPRRRSGP